MKFLAATAFFLAICLVMTAAHAEPVKCLKPDGTEESCLLRQSKSGSTAKDPKDRLWVALTRVQCSGVSVVIWREVDDPTDYYGTTEYAWNDASSGRFPRLQGFIYNDATGEAFLNGQPCKNVR
jgi:hypothetical protein